MNVLWLTASLFNMFVEEDPGCFGGLRRLLRRRRSASPRGTCARSWPPTPSITLVNGYGPVESTVFAMVHEITAGDRRTRERHPHRQGRRRPADRGAPGRRAPRGRGARRTV
ncbi:hypothetical protein LT493_17155 [Streptomyces tricolor]|nr:hypothetical protein [Streptomyces tricolor]